MASLAKLLSDVLARHGLREAGRDRPLYRYRLRADDLQAIGEAAAETRWRDWSAHEAEAVALYAAHQLCREHREGPWKWETALGFEPTLAQKEQLIEALTRRWHRPLLQSGRGREVLWSLGREGGLPHHLLVGEADRLGRVLRAVLRDRERLPKVVLTAELVADHAQRLSPRYRVEGMHEVLIELVDAVVELRRRVAGQADPVAALEQHCPGWRDGLPLLFEGDHADMLVRGLLAAPKGEAKDSPFAFEARLVKLGARWRVVRRVAELPAQVIEETLKALFGVDLPHHARLLAVSARGERFLLAELSRVGDGTRFRLRPARAADLPLQEALSLRLHGPHGFEAAVGEPEGFEGLSAEEPWIFAEDGRLLGTGSVWRRDPVFFGVWPGVWRSHPAPQSLGEAEGGPDAARIWRVEAPTRIHPPDQEVPFELSPGAAKAPVTVWRLQGRFEALAGVGTVVLRGTPEVRKRVDEGAWQRGVGRLEYARLHEPGKWDSLDASVAGEIWLRVRDEGRVVSRRRVLRVPDDFKVEFKTEQKIGEVRLSCPSRSLRRLEVCGRDDLDVSFELGRVSVPEGASASPRLRLRVGLQGVKDFEIEVPDPRTRAAFVGPGGVAVTEPVAVDRLLGLRAEVGSGSGPQRWRVEGRAWRNDGEGKAREVVTGWIHLGELRPADERRQVLDLGELESDLRLLLAQTGNLDAEVELALKAWDAPRPAKTLCVKQYPRVLKVVRPEGDMRPVPDLIALEAGDETPLTVRVQPIGDPAHPGFEAEPLEGGWAWPAAARQDGAWLVTAQEGEAAEPVPGARPRRVTLRKVALGMVAPTEGLEAAIAEGSKTRSKALRAAFDALATDAAHEDWPLLEAHLDTLGLWPATTYDVVVQLAKHPQALALAVLRRAWMGKLVGLPEAFESLPFAWWQVPAGDWRNAFRCLEKQIDQLQRAYFSQLPAWWIVELTKTCNHLEGAGGLLSTLKRFLNPDPGKPAPLNERLFDAHQGLLRRGTEQDWPGVGARGALEALLTRIALPQDTLWGHLPHVGGARDGRLNDHRDDVRAAPLIAAWITAHGGAGTLDLEQTMALRRARAFDPEWFETAWGLAFPHFFAEQEGKR